MLAKIKVTSNAQEIEQAKQSIEQHRKNIFVEQDEQKKKELIENTPKVPKTEFAKLPLMFDIDDVQFAFQTIDKNIVISIHGEKFSIDYDAKIWAKLVEKFN